MESSEITHPAKLPRKKRKKVIGKGYRGDRGVWFRRRMHVELTETEPKFELLEIFSELVEGLGCYSAIAGCRPRV